MNDLIPGYTQTKSKKRFPYGPGMPEYIIGARASEVMDNNGKKYIDWTASLGSMIVGYYNFLYADSHYFSCLPMKTESEDQLADLLCNTINIADMVRFFKNGSDACTAAVRLAQKVTGRKRIFSYGYHGWHDWAQIDNNDLWDIKDLCGSRLLTLLRNYDPACFILEPVSRKDPILDMDYLREIRNICYDKGIVLIFDQILWGFRTSLQGVAMEIEPDLACYGKAMSNGFPLSALVGRKWLMENFDETGITGTYFSDDVSFRAAITNINILKSKNYLEFNKLGDEFSERLSLTVFDPLGDLVSVKNFGPWCAFDWHNKIAQHVFIQEIIKKGILFNRDWFLMFSHNKEDIEKTLNTCKEVFTIICFYHYIKNDLSSLINTKLRIEL